MGVLGWSRTAAKNDAADPTVPAATGLAQRLVGPALRSLMASLRRYSDAQGGALVTSGALNAYAVDAGLGVTEPVPGLHVVVRAHRDNTDAATLNIDGIGPLPWLDGAGGAFQPGYIQAGRLYDAFYDEELGGFRSRLYGAGEIPGFDSALLAKADARLNAGRGTGLVLRPIQEMLHGGWYDPRNYGAVPGTGGTTDQQRDRALQNQSAFQAAARDFRQARIDGLDAKMLIPPGEYLVTVGQCVGGHYLGPANLPLTNGWSSHTIFLDGYIDDLRGKIYGGLIHSEGRLIRLERDPLNLDFHGNGSLALFNSLDSVMFISRWDGLRITGTLDFEGYQADEKRSVASGNGLDVSYDVNGLYVENIIGWKGSNSALVVGLNRRNNGFGIPGQEPNADIDYDVTRPCRNIYVNSIVAINGEHGVLLSLVQNYWIGSVLVYRKPVYYRGILRSGYMQRGVYVLCAQGYIQHIKILDGPQKAGVYIACYSASRTAFDTDAKFGVIEGRANENQDADDHALVSVSDANDDADPAAYRVASIDIDLLKSAGYKIAFNWQDSRDDNLPKTALVSEDQSIIKYLRIGEHQITGTGRGIIIRPFGGSTGRIIIGKGTIRVAPDTAFSAVQRPIGGLHVESYAELAYAVALANPTTLAGIAAITKPVPGQMAYVGDWPGGARMVTYDAKTTGAIGLSGWRPARPPRPILSLLIDGLTITSGARPAFLAGIAELDQAGVVYNYEDMGFVTEYARALEIYQVGSYVRTQYITSDGFGAKQTAAVKVAVPARNTRPVVRSYTKDYAPIVAGGVTAADDIGMAGVRPGDVIDVGCDTDIPGWIPRAVCITPDFVRLRHVNLSGATLDPPLATYTLINRSGVP